MKQASRLSATRIACALALACVLAPIAVSGAANITYLGKPTNDVSPISAFPLGGFHHIKGVLPPKRTLVALGDIGGDMERWAVVKALDQFGALADLSGVDGVCHVETTDPYKGYQFCASPSYDWSHAAYRSRYITFDHRDLHGLADKPYQTPTKREAALLIKYAEPAGCRPSPASQTICLPYTKLPLMAVGDYLQIGTKFLTGADFGKLLPAPTSTVYYGGTTTGLPFEQIRDALATGKEPSSISRLIPDVNAEANIITALICHADGKKPKSVCGRKVIKTLMKHLK